MHVGMSSFFQNFGVGQDDAEIYRHEIAVADLAEPLGFDSIWSAEHHFNGYTMCPNVLQFLTFMAGRTERVQLGSMVVVLPWHDPVRVTEEICVLDNLSGGRTILGLGRGLGRIEFNGFRVPMGESRERFVAYSNAIVNALETGVLESRHGHIPPATGPDPASAPQELSWSTLRGGNLSGDRAHRGALAGRFTGDRAKTLGKNLGRPRGVQEDLPRGQRRRGAPTDARDLDRLP